MNRDLYRIVFNAARGQLMAVAENIAARRRRGGKSSAPGRVRGVAFSGLAVALMAASSAQAQIVAYRNAPGAQRATILATGNGVPLINIQTPSAAGVSHNAYSQFDVTPSGAILNNSLSAANTQLAGWISGNPWLASGSARLILNEVVSANPSRLNGHVEVAGTRAEVIIANPAGINCTGCGFINAQRATLTTGTPQLRSGALDGYRVAGGTIRISGSGLDAGSTDYTELIARTIKVDAAIRARTLSISAGNGEVRIVDAIDGTNTAFAATATAVGAEAVNEAANEMAIDVAELGGMYAGKIRLVATGAGVGVRNAGTIAASAGDVVVSSDGQLQNSGQISAAAGALISSSGVDNSGTIAAKGDVAINADGGVDNRSRLQANGRLTITAASISNATSGEIIATSLQLTATDEHTLSNRGLIDAGDALIDSPTINNLGSGRIYGDHLAITAATLTNSAEAGSAPVIAARDRLDIGAATIVNSASALILSLGDLAIGGVLDAYRQASGQAALLDNHAAAIEATGNLTISAAQIVNRNANLTTSVAMLADQHIVEYQGSGAAMRYAQGTPGVYVFNDESDQLMTPAGKYEDWLRYDYTRTTSETQLEHNDPASLLAGGTMRLSADTLLNDNSRIIAGGALTADVATLTNQAASGERTVSDHGSVTSYWRDHDKGRDSTGSDTAAYTPPSTIETITLGTSVFRQNTPPSGSAATAFTAHSIGETFALPDNALFHTLAANSGSHFLVETDARLTASRAWLSSDYQLAQLVDPSTLTQKRLGDGYYEQRLVREQIARLNGQRFLAGHADDEAQYRALMDAALPYAALWQLIPGIALSAEQMAQLTSDIVWLVEQDVALADGTMQSALVPRVYALAADGDPPPANGLIAAKTVNLTLSGDLDNAGAIAARQRLALDAEDIRNTGGRISADETLVSARGDLANLGGTFYATDTLIVSAGHDLTLASTTRSQDNAQGSRSNIDRVARLMVGASQGTLVASAGNDLTLFGAVIENATPASHGSVGNTTLLAGRDIVFGTVSESNGQSIVWDGQNQRRDAYHSEVGSTLRSAGDITIQAGHNLSLVAASIGSERGALSVTAGNDLNITAGQADSWVDEAHQHSESGLLSHTTRSTRDTLNATDAIASTLSAETATISAGRGLRLVGSNVVANTDLTLRAASDIVVETAAETRSETHFNEVSKSGLFSSGGIGFTLGSRQQSTEQTFNATNAAASTVGSIAGDVMIESGKGYRQVGSDVIAVDGSIDIAAQRVDIVEAHEIWRDSVETRTRQSGLTIAITSPVISAVQTAQRMQDAQRATDDPRLRTLAAASGALALKGGVDALVSGQGTTIAGKANQMPTYDDNGKVNGSRDATSGERAGGVNLSISIGGSASRSTTTQTGDNAAASTLVAGQDIHINASGAGSDSDLLLRGAVLTAGRDITLTASNQIDLLAAANTAEQDSSNSAQSASVGFSIGTNGLLFNVGASMMRGRADGSETTWSNSTVDAGAALNLASGGDARLIGAVARGKQVVAEIGGNLELASLQDTSTYASKQHAAGFSVSIGMGRISGSLSLSRSKIDSDYASVVEQSGIQSGDGGFQVKVGGDTHLTGAVIASTQAAVDANRNAFVTGGTPTLRDIANHADYEASSASINLGSSVSFSGSLPAGGIGTGAGFGEDSGSANATTRSGITGIAGNSAVRSGDVAGAIAPIFDADKVQSEIDAQTQITQTFGQLASQAVGDYAASQVRKSAELYAQAATESDAERRNELETQAATLEDQWGAQGSLRLVAHTLIGGLTGRASGAAGAAAGTITAPLVAEQLQLAGIDGPLATTLTALASTAAGAAVGGIMGAGTAFNEVENNYLYHYKGRIIAYDKNDNDKLIELSDEDLRRLVAQNPEIVLQVVAVPDQQNAPALVLDSSAMMMTDSRIFDLDNPIDREQIARESDMGYINLTDQSTRIYVQTGMDNTRSDARRSAQLLSELLKQPAGYINNGTQGLPNDVGEYLPNALDLKDVLNEYTYRTLNAKGPTLIALHSAGNEDARKALLAGSLYDHRYDQLSFVSLGSPVGAGALQAAIGQGGAHFLGQINDWRDPITYSKTAVTVGVGSFLTGMGYGATQGCTVGIGGGPLGCVFSGVIGAAVGGVAGALPAIAGNIGLKYYHPFDQYIAKPQTQSLLFDWQRANPLKPAGQ